MSIQFLFLIFLLPFILPSSFLSQSKQSTIPFPMMTTPPFSAVSSKTTRSNSPPPPTTV